MNFNPVVWFEIYVQDLSRAKKFYEAMLEIRLEQLPGLETELWVFPMKHGTGGAAGALVKTPGYPSGGNSTMIYFGCEDCSMEESRVAAIGGRVEKSKMSIGDYGFISLVVDTEGNMIGLHSQK